MENLRMETKPKNSLDRRTLLAGAGAIGAVGVVAAVAAQREAEPAPQQTAEARLESDGGYQLTEHVKRYYATARI